MNFMKIIGLTGGIGSGKSTVLKMFKELGVDTYVADVEAKKIMNSDKELIRQICEAFGEKTYVNGVLNNSYLASVVFNNKEKLTLLNGLVHPKVKEHFNAFIQTSISKFIIYEAAILFESGSSKFCDLIITVIADFKDRLERIQKRDKISEAQILERVNNQLDDNFKIKHSNFVIKNTNLNATKLQVKTIFELISKTCNN